MRVGEAERGGRGVAERERGNTGAEEETEITVDLPSADDLTQTNLEAENLLSRISSRPELLAVGELASTVHS